MSIADRMAELVAALPEKRASSGKRTVREACLLLCEDGRWEVMAGGHPSVHIGEYGGDYWSDGPTPEEAIAACLKLIQPQGVPA